MNTKIATYLKQANSRIGRRIMIILFAAGLSLGASAQRGVNFHGSAVVHGGYHGGGVVYAYPRTYVGLGLGFGYYPWGYPFWGPFGWGYYPYPPYYYGYGAMPSELAVHIQDIKNDYNAQIKDVRHDKSIPRKDRKAKISQLKKDRDAAVIQARKDYFYQHYQRRDNSNGPHPYNDNGSQPQQKSQKPVSGSDEGPEYQNSQSSTGGATTQGQ
jgi:hypothetical protein